MRKKDSTYGNETSIFVANSHLAHSKEAGIFTKRIGYTTYRVGVYFCGKSSETAREKILRLAKTELLAEQAVSA
jgi:hypothetical protein